ncbi:MAG TPA: glycosyltransferase family A protein [Bacteroidia bacterium]|nr:glycosyltransferase family A protein [Bacteroidia bacterium]
MQPLLNILIRTSNRPTLFARCLDSILDQSYKNIRIIVSTDREVKYVPQWIETVEVTPRPELDYGYDLYINDLKAKVTEGYFIVVDDDDILEPECLSKLDLSHPAILCQLKHIGNIMPTSNEVKLGRVAMPCIILHHSLKHIDIIHGDHNDYNWIKRISEEVELNFQPVVVVRSDRKSNGVC